MNWRTADRPVVGSEVLMIVVLLRWIGDAVTDGRRA
jgi:hypothetical protein